MIRLLRIMADDDQRGVDHHPGLDDQVVLLELLIESFEHRLGQPGLGKGKGDGNGKAEPGWDRGVRHHVLEAIGLRPIPRRPDPLE